MKACVTNIKVYCNGITISFALSVVLYYLRQRRAHCDYHFWVLIKEWKSCCTVSWPKLISNHVHKRSMLTQTGDEFGTVRNVFLAGSHKNISYYACSIWAHLWSNKEKKLLRKLLSKIKAKMLNANNKNKIRFNYKSFNNNQKYSFRKQFAEKKKLLIVLIWLFLFKCSLILSCYH
jgi:hypothetical protein